MPAEADFSKLKEQVEEADRTSGHQPRVRPS